MNGKRSRMVFNLTKNKDINLIRTLIYCVGHKKFEKMNGISIYRWAKRNWKQLGIKHAWGRKEKV